MHTQPPPVLRYAERLKTHAVHVLYYGIPYTFYNNRFKLLQKR